MKYGYVRDSDTFSEQPQVDCENYENDSNFRLISDFLHDYLIRVMTKAYGLKEVWFPEKRHVGMGPKCNIFMSREFHDPDQKENSKKDALILIQGIDPVRAGEWDRFVCVKENLYQGSMLP